VPLLLLTYHTLYSARYDHLIQNVSHDCREPAKAYGFMAKPASRVSATQSKQSEGQSDTKVGQQLAHLGPIRGDPTSSSFVSESRSGGFLHAPLCGLASSRLGFATRDYPRKSLETTWPRFDGAGGGGVLAPVWSFGEALALAGSPP
jgi:hypothetical protein